MRYHFMEVMEQCTCQKLSIMVFIYTNSTYTSDRELLREITLEDMKMYGSTPRHEDEVQCQEDLVPFELRWR